MAPAYSDVNNVRNLSSQVHIQSELQFSQNLIDELVNGFVRQFLVGRTEGDSEGHGLSARSDLDAFVDIKQFYIADILYRTFLRSSNGSFQ